MLPEKVKIVEVGPRDGLQNEKTILSVAQKTELINRLTNSGLQNIEVGSFVSPKWVPQMSNTADVFQNITKAKNVCYSALVPNLIGLEHAIESNVQNIAVFAAASETFSQKNINCSINESLDNFALLCQKAKKQNMRIRGYISCVMGCPYEGDVDIHQVIHVAKALYHMGCDEISLGDTIGVGTPLDSQNCINAVSQHVPLNKIAVHFHDTYGQALANIYACLKLGIHIIDSSVGGLGGCPYAAGASGNVATEDVLYMLHGLHIKTDINISKIVETTHFIESIFERPLPSKLSKIKKDNLLKI